jgi:hypothetical protein
MVVKVNKTLIKNAYIDWRFDQPTDFNLFGQPVASFTNTRPVIDQIKRSGFNGIVLNTNVPIDPETGNLVLIDPAGGANANKNIPKDTWKVVQYAKKMGLSVTINFNIVDYRNDNGIAENSIGANFNKDKFFKAVGDYESVIAKQASKYGVNTIGIGFNQFGLDTEEYRSQWQGIVNKIDKVYKGSLIYSTYADSNNAVWSMVDTIGAIGDNSAATRASVAGLAAKFNKPVYLDSIRVESSNVDSWGMLMSGQDLTKITPDYNKQAATIKEILKSAIVDYKNDLSGVSFFEYAPWQQANWIQKPQDETSKQWNAVTKLNSEFINNPTAENAFKNWFNYSTAPINGTTRNDKLTVYAGDKTVDGKKGIDTVVVLNNAKDCTLTKESTGYFTLHNNTEGIDKLYNCEYVQFLDTRVSLIGHQDYSQFGWTAW